MNGSCCGGSDDHEDNGLDSTLSISIRDEVDKASDYRTDRKAILMGRRRNRSRIAPRVNFDQTASPLKKNVTRSINKQQVPRLRQAFSQVCKDELAQEHRMRDSESIEDSVFAAMLEKAEIEDEAPPMTLVRH